MRLWRITGAAYPVWSGEGARIAGARWNPPGHAVIYTGMSYAISALETLVHIGKMPKRLNYVHADIPEDAPVEEIAAGEVTSWANDDFMHCRDFGKAWLQEQRSLVLLVPSVVTGGLDRNGIVNPKHPDFSRIFVSTEQPVIWDRRLVLSDS